MHLLISTSKTITITLRLVLLASLFAFLSILICRFLYIMGFLNKLFRNFLADRFFIKPESSGKVWLQRARSITTESIWVNSLEAFFWENTEIIFIKGHQHTLSRFCQAKIISDILRPPKKKLLFKFQFIKVPAHTYTSFEFIFSSP